jgi:hypothetical protein
MFRMGNDWPFGAGVSGCPREAPWPHPSPTDADPGRRRDVDGSRRVRFGACPGGAHPATPETPGR